MKTFFRKVRLGYFTFSLLSVDIITDVKSGGRSSILPPSFPGQYLYLFSKETSIQLLILFEVRLFYFVNVEVFFFSWY